MTKPGNIVVYGRFVKVLNWLILFNFLRDRCHLCTSTCDKKILFELSETKYQDSFGIAPKNK